jgi:2,3-bisphosphoglycerate-dependent phosphoglycerate mutase
MNNHKIDGSLIVVRHHESDWNKMGLWTGSRDRHLTEYGFKKSEEMGKSISDIKIDLAFSSMKVRTIETLSSMLEGKGQFDVPTEHVQALNERDYGIYTGKNKWDMLALVGKEEWEAIRREWNKPIPEGETMKMVYERALPFYLDVIVPELRKGKNILIVAHGNSLRALAKYIENINDEDIKDVEIPFGNITIYTVDNEGQMISKELRIVESRVNA